MSVITTPRHDAHLAAVVVAPGDAATSSDQRFEVEVIAAGSFALTYSLMESVGDQLVSSRAMEDPILSANLARGTVDLRVAVRAESKSEAQGVAARALARALRAAGVEEVRVRRSGWRGGILVSACSPALSPA
jgi:hypothetical protein